MAERFAWLTFLNSDDYYIYMLLNLYYDLQKVQTKYPLYCGVTKAVSAETRERLKTVGIKLLEMDETIISKDLKASVKINNSKQDLAHYYKALVKLVLFKDSYAKFFDKVVYLDTDIQILSNIDDLFNFPHMSAVEDQAPFRSPTKIPYTIGSSKFCSGLIVWDYKNNPGLGKKILDSLNTLDLKLFWHDQAILNYYFKDWQYKTELHIPPEYCMMNLTGNFEQIWHPKAIHHTGRIKDFWPFNDKIFLVSVRWSYYKNIKEYLEAINNTIIFYNNKYNFNFPLLHLENITIKPLSNLKITNGGTLIYNNKTYL